MAAAVDSQEAPSPPPVETPRWSSQAVLQGQAWRQPDRCPPEIRRVHFASIVAPRSATALQAVHSALRRRRSCAPVMTLLLSRARLSHVAPPPPPYSALC